MTTITNTRHQFGTADVNVEDAPDLTAPSRESGAEFTIQPDNYYLEDEDDYGYRIVVTASGLMRRKNGELAARRVRVVPRRSQVPAAVWNELLRMRPDLAIVTRFTSRATSDSEPWAYINNPSIRYENQPAGLAGKYVYRPRSEYSASTVNPSNGLLAYIRTLTAGMTPDARLSEYDLWLSAIAGDDPETYAQEDRDLALTFPAAVRDHTIRVLARLTRAAFESSAG